MVLAGPGSGKTAVIAGRAVHLIRERGVKPESLLVITFTRAAAEEMRTRCLMTGLPEASAIPFGTFHSTFYRILRRDGALGTRRVMSERDRRKRMGEALAKTVPGIAAEGELVSELLSAASKVHNAGADPASLNLFSGRLPFPKILERYEAEKRKENLLDFDDMLTETRTLLQARPDVRAFWSGLFEHIMIDEFQDINPIQYDVVRLLAAPRNNLFIVGDDDQSIYGFRAAAPEIMLNFPRDYEGAARILLDKNYRSGKKIVEASLRTIGENRVRFQKALRPAVREDGRIFVRRFRTSEEESADISMRCLEAMSRGVPAGRIGILTRTHSGAAQVLLRLTEDGVPFLAADRVPNVFRHPVCRPLFAYLNWTRGGRTRRNFLLFMNAPVRYIRRDDLASEQVDPEELKEKLAHSPEPWRAKPVERLIYQLRFLKELGVPYAMVNYVRKAMEYDRHLKDTLPKETAEEDLLVLDEVQESARGHDTLESWYTHIAKYTAEMEKQEKIRTARAEDRVFVSTIHGAKGLEFDTVFLPQLNEKVLPSEKALKPGEIEEERRVFYVGLTRAEKDLHLSFVTERFGKKMEVSRFLKEI